MSRNQEHNDRPLESLSATEMMAQLEADALTCESLVAACLARTKSSEDDIRAWNFLDADSVLEQARSRDAERQQGTARGILHGIPVAIKDMIYTADMPTEHNSPLYEGHWPQYDAACVTLLKNAGAIIMGKAHTVEFASMGRLAPTRNPHDPQRTPGGSSSGSAAAVAACMVPLALGTQTGGSTIRPASFCGIYGMKPTYSTIPIEGVRPYAPSLDTVGLMARSIEDIALLCQVFVVVEETVVPMELNSKRRVGLFRTSMWEAAQESSQRAVLESAEKIAAAGVEVVEVESAVDFDELTEAQNIVMHGEGRRTFLAEHSQFKETMHPDTLGEAENILGITGEQLRQSSDFIARARIQVEREMAGFDAWLTPAVTGEAPRGLDSTGVAQFNRCWSALHSPCITVPAFSGAGGMPVGIQFTAPRFEDYRLLAITAALDPLIRLSH